MLAILRHGWPAIALVVLLVLGAKVRLDSLGVYQPGDMDVMLTITYNLLLWPPVNYYHNHMGEPWVYNHLPLFPMALAPFYWVFENLLQFPTTWAPRLLTGAADLALAVVLYRQGRGRWSAELGLAAAALWLFSPWVVAAGDHPVGVAALFAVLALATVERGGLCGLMLGLGVATRSEIAFFVLPLALHFLTKRRPAELVAFLAALGVVVAAVAAPFALTDPAAMDYALRGQIQRDASDLTSTVYALLLPALDLPTAAVLQKNPSLLALGVNLLVSLLALRDRRVSRVVLLAAVAYLLTLPLLHTRYLIFACAVGLYYATRFGNPLVAGAVLAVMTLSTGHGEYVLIGLFLLLALAAVWRPGAESDPWDRRLHAIVKLAPYREGWARLSVTLLLLAGVYAAVAASQRLPAAPAPPWDRARFLVNLVTKAEQKRLKIVSPTGTVPEDYVHVKRFTLGEDRRDVIFMHPSASASLPVDLPPGAVLEFAMALDPEVWDKAGDGVDFVVGVRDDEQLVQLFSSYVDPKGDPSQRRWVESAVDLGRYAGRRVELVLQTQPHGSGDFDWAGWGMPRVVRR